MQCWQFSFLGGVEATYKDVHLNDLMGRKAGAVLALLALSPGRARSREEIINLVWPDVDYEEARDRFKQQLTLLRKLLEPGGVAPGSVLITTRSQAGIASGHQSDVAQFQNGLRRAALAADKRERAQCLREALALYKGEFAPGFYLDVLLSERQRLAELAEEAQKRLVVLEASEPDEPAAAAPPLPLPNVLRRPLRTHDRFFGRDGEREQIPRLLAQHRLVTLLGPGGTGKTRLMQEMLPALSGAHLVFLSTLRNGAAIPDAIVAALNLPESNETALPRLHAAFADKETLLMLDNVEQLVASGGAEAVAELLETIPTLRLLVTSRIKLNLPEECVCTLSPLPQNEAIELFVNRASLARASFVQTGENRDAIAELCRRLDGLPLALELAAARTPILTPAQILDRLTRRFDLLTDRRKDREERHASLRAALDWGWGLLAPDVQQFFAQLCVFRGSFSLDAAETITGEPLAIDHLQYLADASFLLVESDNGQEQRFRLLETLREYGAEKWDKNADETLPHRHADFFLERARQWSRELEGEGFAVAMAAFKQDHDNFIAALDVSLQFDPLRALELCRQMADYWRYAYLKREALHFLVQMLQAVQAGGFSDKLTNHQWASLHSSLANAYQDVQDYGRAHEHFQQSLVYHDKQVRATKGDTQAAQAHQTARRFRAGALHNFANTLFYENRFDDAHRYYAEAAAVNREMGNAAWLANNLNGLCHICGRQAFQSDGVSERTRLFEQGLLYAGEAVAICRNLHQDYFLGYMLVVQSDMLLGLEREADALPVVAEGFALSFALENWEVVAEFLVHYHHLAFRRELWDVATQLIGVTTGIGERWNIDIEAEATHLSITDARREALSGILGPECYGALYGQGLQIGSQMEREALRALVSAI